MSEDKDIVIRVAYECIKETMSNKIFDDTEKLEMIHIYLKNAEQKINECKESN